MVKKDDQQNDNLKNDVLAQLGLGNIPDEKKAEIISKISELAQKRIILRVTEEMSEDQRENFEKFLETEEDPAKIENYIRENIPNIDSIIEEEMSLLKNDVLSQMKEIE